MMTAVTFADAWYVGRLGKKALASLALAFPFLTQMQMMAGNVTSAVARLVQETLREPKAPPGTPC